MSRMTLMGLLKMVPLMVSMLKKQKKTPKKLMSAIDRHRGAFKE